MRSAWPVLSYPEAKETYQTLHLWLQILGKIKLAKLPWLNHSWHVTLMVTPLGISTGFIPDANDHFQIDLNLVEHKMVLLTSSGRTRTFELRNNAVADFYLKIRDILEELQIRVIINPMPNEIEDAVRFDQDRVHATYMPEHAALIHRSLLQIQDVFTRFRAGFNGKCSPVHLFWGSFDLAVSRFSGRPAPPHPGGVPNLPDWVAREAYSHEVSSSGFWFGDNRVPFAAFYSYFYPEPEGFREAEVTPSDAYYHEGLGEFILPYEIVRQSAAPEETLLSFLRSTYNAGSKLAHWNKESFETAFKHR